MQLGLQQGRTFHLNFRKVSRNVLENILPLYNPSHNIAPSHKLLLIDAVFDDVHPLFAVIPCCTVTAMNGNTVQQTTRTAPSVAPSVDGGSSASCMPAPRPENLPSTTGASSESGRCRMWVPPESFSKQFSALFQHHFSCEVAKDAEPALWPPPPHLLPMTARLRITPSQGCWITGRLCGREWLR